MNSLFFDAAKKKYEAEIAEAKAVLVEFLTEPMVIADHSDILGEIDKWLSVLAEAQDKLRALVELGSPDLDFEE